MFISSTTPLEDGDSWSSDSQTMDRADRIAGIVYSDQSGVLYIEQSADNENWDVSKSINVTGDEGQGFSEEILGAYARVRFENNSGSDQTALRITAKATSAGDS